MTIGSTTLNLLLEFLDWALHLQSGASCLAHSTTFQCLSTMDGVLGGIQVLKAYLPLVKAYLHLEPMVKLLITLVNQVLL